MRYLFFLFSLAFAAPAAGQIYIDSYRFGGFAPGDLLLDSFPGAAGAWSFRLLDKDYTGNAIMVQRASDNDSLNIGFEFGYLDTVALKVFCASTNCGVRTWYDQTGNGYHARKDTFSLMPRIVNNGVIVRSGGVPVMKRDTQSLWIPQNIGLASQSIFTALALNIAVDETTPPAFVFLSDTATTNLFGFGSVTGLLTDERHSWTTSADLGATILGSGQTTNNLSAGNYLFSHLFQQSPNAVTAVYKNGTQETMTASSQGVFTTTNYPKSWNFGSKTTLPSRRNNSLFEIIVYPTYQSSNRAAIETNINSFYSIY